MTADTRERLSIPGRVNGIGDFIVAFQARGFRHLQVMWFDLDRVMKLPGGKCEGVPKSVRCLCQIFGNRAGRRMTIVAGGRQAMA